MPEPENQVDIGRANVEAECFRLLTLLSSAEEGQYLVGDLIDELGRDSAETAKAFVDVFLQLDAAVLIELLKGDGAPALERVAAQLAAQRYAEPIATEPAPSPAPSSSSKKKSTKKKAAKKKAAKKKAAKKPPGKRKPRQQTLPQTRQPRTKPETVKFDRKVAKLISDAGDNGVQNDTLTTALDCTKGKLRLSLNRLKSQSYIQQTGERRTARYVITKEGEIFVQDQKEAAA